MYQTITTGNLYKCYSAKGKENTRSASSLSSIHAPYVLGKGVLDETPRVCSVASGAIGTAGAGVTGVAAAQREWGSQETEPHSELSAVARKSHSQYTGTPAPKVSPAELTSSRGDDRCSIA